MMSRALRLGFGLAVLISLGGATTASWWDVSRIMLCPVTTGCLSLLHDPCQLVSY